MGQGNDGGGTRGRPDPFCRGLGFPVRNGGPCQRQNQNLAHEVLCGTPQRSSRLKRTLRTLSMLWRPPSSGGRAGAKVASPPHPLGRPPPPLLTHRRQRAPICAKAVRKQGARQPRPFFPRLLPRTSEAVRCQSVQSLPAEDVPPTQGNGLGRGGTMKCVTVPSLNGATSPVP